MSEARTYTTAQRLSAEALGTFWLVFGGCGTAVLAATAIPEGAQMAVGVGWLGVALAFGLTVLTGVYAFGHISGGTSTPPCRSVWPWPSCSPGRTCPATSWRRSWARRSPARCCW